MKLYPYANVRIYAKESLEQVAAILSGKLFSNIPFGGRDLHIFDEVPGLRLEGDFLGLFVAVHGGDGEYMLLIQAKSQALKWKEGYLPTDISNYIAELVRSLGLWRVEIPKS